MLAALVVGCGDGSTDTTANRPQPDTLGDCAELQSKRATPDVEEFKRCMEEVSKPPVVDCDSPLDLDGWAAKEATEGELPTVRQRIADRIGQCHDLDGRSRGEVRGLLGRPDNYLAGMGGREESWVTGDERGLISIDNEHLVIEYDRADQVRRVLLSTD